MKKITDKTIKLIIELHNTKYLGEFKEVIYPSKKQYGNGPEELVIVFKHKNDSTKNDGSITKIMEKEDCRFWFTRKKGGEIEFSTLFTDKKIINGKKITNDEFFAKINENGEISDCFPPR